MGVQEVRMKKVIIVIIGKKKKKKKRKGKKKNKDELSHSSITRHISSEDEEDGTPVNPKMLQIPQSLLKQKEKNKAKMEKKQNTSSPAPTANIKPFNGDVGDGMEELDETQPL